MGLVEGDGEVSGARTGLIEVSGEFSDMRTGLVEVSRGNTITGKVEVEHESLDSGGRLQ